MPATMNRITQDEARRAVYVDFEGLRDAPPVLMGWLVDDSLTQTVVEGVLCPGAEASSVCRTSHAPTRTRHDRETVVEPRGMVSTTRGMVPRRVRGGPSACRGRPTCGAGMRRNGFERS